MIVAGFFWMGFFMLKVPADSESAIPSRCRLDLCQRQHDSGTSILIC
jgi:hypothetical protein